ncbi:hypothetical protein BDW59DRAFT_166267 [Aspergillus cavernicola]|uniref:NACHT domain-containing protein n=1 Tax=Aspergillus cavernicola TaxID=176166 RepID=A0ABR4HMB1_9EURO
MERTEEYPSRTTFNNQANVKNQAVTQTFNGTVVFGGDQSQNDINTAASTTGLSVLDRNILESLAFPEMLDRRHAIDTPHPNTCEWILDQEKYIDWLDQERGLLWIKGKPGAGKSTIMSFLYRTLKDQPLEGIVLEFFFTGRGTELQRTPLGFLRSLLNQLYRQDMSIRENLRKVYEDKCNTFGDNAFGTSKQKWTWKQQELEDLLERAIIASAEHQLVTVFVDALDEAGRDSAAQLVQFFHRINSSLAREAASGKICISCRHYPVVSSMPESEIWVENHNQSDIASFIYDSMQHDQLWSDDEWQHLEETLTDSAGGIFQWARLVTPHVQRQLSDGESIHNVRLRLGRVPDELGSVYEYILKNTIDPENLKCAYAIFQWVCLAEKPLSVRELRYAMAASDANWSKTEVQEQDIRDMCFNDELMKRRIRAFSGGLIEATSTDCESIIEVIHQSVKEFMLEKGLQSLAAYQDNILCPISRSSITQKPPYFHIEHCQAFLYRSCLYYLAKELEQTKFEDDPNLEALTKASPFLRYAALNIFHHAQKAGAYRSNDLQQEISTLQQMIPRWADLSRSLGVRATNVEGVGQTPLHVSVSCSMTDMVEYLLLDDNSSNGDEQQGDERYTHVKRPSDIQGDNIIAGR